MGNEELIQTMISSGVLKTPEIINVFKDIDRAQFLRERSLSEAYDDYPLPIGNESTISQPSTVAFMLELLEPQEGDSVLDVGSGSGWTTALLGKLVGDSGNVYGVEIDPELVEFGQSNIKKYNFNNVLIGQAHEGILGLPEYSPYDKILISAAAKNIPEDLIEQLKVGGTMVIPVQSSIWKVSKVSETETDEEEFFGFSFVPLR